MMIQFRSNKHQLPSNADGYYYSKGVRGSFGSPVTLQLFFVGTLENDVLNVSCWKVPEMLKEKTETYDIEKAGICLIRKSISPSMELKV